MPCIINDFYTTIAENGGPLRERENKIVSDLIRFYYPLKLGECEVDSNYNYAFISKNYFTNEPDTFLLYIGDACVKFPVTMVDTVIKNVKLVMEQYDNDLHEEQLADERSTDAE